MSRSRPFEPATAHREAGRALTGARMARRGDRPMRLDARVRAGAEHFHRGRLLSLLAESSRCLRLEAEGQRCCVTCRAASGSEATTPRAIRATASSSVAEIGPERAQA